MLGALLTAVLAFTLAAVWVHLRRVTVLAQAVPSTPDDADLPETMELTVTARSTR